LITLTATPTPESTTLSLHDALPICRRFCICHSLRRHVAAGETENRELDCAERFQPGGHPAPVPQKTGAYGPAHHLPVYCSGNGIFQLEKNMGGAARMKKVVILGPESTGKSTLSQQLATHYHTEWVPEYARQYLEELGRPYEQHDLLTIAAGQLGLEDEMAQKAQGLLICDTDLYVIKVWSEH